MSEVIKEIVIVGGGTAGWLTAGILAAEHVILDQPDTIKITLVESPTIATIGVGEGTWPSMRETLKTIGVSETEFLKECDASFKQGSHFIGWLHGQNDHYYHPFSLPENYHNTNLANHWLHFSEQVPFDRAVTFQAQLCEQGLAPKQITTPEYSFIGNYGYHLDAGKFSEFIKRHCVEKLGVNHILADVTEIKQADNGDIKSILCDTTTKGSSESYGENYSEGLDKASDKHSNEISGDLFIDCTGNKALLIAQTLNVPFVSQKHVLFNDRALAVQIPYDEGQEINSATNATAQANGWIWDIGLQSRRGVGHVYSSAHCSDETARKTLEDYIAATCNANISELNIRPLSFEPGHRAEFWRNNCLAIGMSAGFIEPLEASAIALIEQSAKYLANQLPKTRTTMNIVAKRFNLKFSQRWGQIIEFLKLHYILTKRSDTKYWRDAASRATLSEEFLEKLQLWQHQCPYNYDSFATEELFPSASYQYVYYGMGGQTERKITAKMQKERQQVNQILQDNQNKTNQLMKVMPSNRALLEKIRTFGLSKV